MVPGQQQTLAPRAQPGQTQAAVRAPDPPHGPLGLRPSPCRVSGEKTRSRDGLTSKVLQDAARAKSSVWSAQELRVFGLPTCTARTSHSSRGYAAHLGFMKVTSKTRAGGEEPERGRRVGEVLSKRPAWLHVQAR